jgi:hypothetical protein
MERQRWRDRGGETERDRDGETDRQTQTDTDRQRAYGTCGAYLFKFLVFRKFREQNVEKRFLVSKFGRKKVNFLFPFSKSGTGKS